MSGSSQQICNIQTNNQEEQADILTNRSKVYDIMGVVAAAAAAAAAADAVEIE